MGSFKRYAFVFAVAIIIVFSALHLDRNPSSNKQERSDCKQEQPLLDLNFGVEFEAVRSNLDKCLRAAELTEYFHSKGFYGTAVRNAAYLLSFVRGVVPQNFSRKFSMPCWWAHFEVTLHLKEVTSSINGKMFKSPKVFWHTTALKTLESEYNGIKTSELVCLPNIFLAGFPKCGTTYLYCLLRRIAYMAQLSGWRGQIEKEPHMWVSKGPEYYHQYPHQVIDLTQYLFNFIPSVEAILSSQQSVAIDASPNLLFQWPRYTPWESMENYCLLPAVLPQILPNNKYIVVMREPTSMLYSAFWFSCITLNGTLTRQQQVDAPNIFHVAVMKAIEIFQQCTEQYPTDKCVDAVYHTRVSYLSTRSCLTLRFETGFYYHYIRRWLAVVPRRQFLFLTTEELNKSSHYKEILEFMNSRVINKSVEGNGLSFDDIKCEKKESKFKYQTDPVLRMRKDTRKLLNDFFAPFNQKLSNLLEDDKFLWKS